MKLLFVIVFLLASVYADAQPLNWQRTGSLPLPANTTEFGYVDQILVVGKDSVLAFVKKQYGADAFQHLYLSNDAGENWKDLQDSTPFDGKTIVLSDGSLLHGTPGDYWGAYAGLYHSTDLGKTWIILRGSNVYDLCAVNKNEYYVLGSDIISNVLGRVHDTVLHSTDYGLHWQKSFLIDIYFQSEIYGIGILDNDVYITPYGKLLRSKNHGISWDTVLDAELTFVSDNGNSLFCQKYSDTGLFISSSGDSGSWIERSIPFNKYHIQTEVNGMPLVAHKGQILTMGFLSSDSGKTWVDFSKKISGLDTSLVDPRLLTAIAIDSSGRCFYGDGDYILRSVDSGKTWVPKVLLPDNFSIGAIPFIADERGSLWTQYGNNAFGEILYHSTDNGATWDSIPHPVTAMAEGRNGSFLAASKDSGIIIIRTSDDGKSWSKTSSIPTKTQLNEIGELGFGKLIGFDYNGNCFHSEDHGATWSSTRVAPEVYTLSAFYVADSMNVYGGSQGNFFSSHDGGYRWNVQNTPGVLRQITSICKDFNNAIVAVFDDTIQQLLRTTNDGSSWSDWSSGIPAGTIIYNIISPTETTVYAATSDGIYYQSSLHPGTWYKSSAGFDDNAAVAIASIDAQTFYGIGSHGNIYKTGVAKSVHQQANSNSEISIFPNPAITSTTITYSLPNSQYIKLELIDQLGRIDQLIRDGYEDAGEKNISLSLNQLPDGVYYLRIQNMAGVFIEKIVKAN